jgi:AcrR family transcriptional regulator
VPICISKPSEEGLRARKRRQTRERITAAGIRLFLERGYAATTVDDIAAAADISKRSFFDYFATKDDVVFERHAEFDRAFIAAVAARPAEERPLAVVEHALASSLAAAATPENFAIDKLVQATPALHARAQLKYERLEAALAEALLARSSGGKKARLQARLVAMLAIGVLRVGSQWYRETESRDSPSAQVRQIMRTLEAEFATHS